MNALGKTHQSSGYNMTLGRLLEGLDDIGLTLAHADEIRAFEAKRLADQPWLA